MDVGRWGVDRGKEAPGSGWKNTVRGRESELDVRAWSGVQLWTCDHKMAGGRTRGCGVSIGLESEKLKE